MHRPALTISAVAAALLLVLVSDPGQSASHPVGSDILVADQEGVEVWQASNGGYLVITDANLLSPRYLQRQAFGQVRMFTLRSEARVLHLERAGHAFQIALSTAPVLAGPNLQPSPLGVIPQAHEGFRKTVLGRHT